MSRQAVLITRDELTNAKLQEIFRHAQVEASIVAGNLCLTIDGLKIIAEAFADRGYVSLGCNLILRPGTASRQALELSNRINEGLAFIKAYFGEGSFRLVFLDYIDTNTGVSAEEVVDEARRFRAAIRSAMALDTEHIVEATMRSYVQRCLEPEFAEGEEPRNWQSDPAFQSVLDSLDAGDLTTAAQQAENFAAQFPDLDLPYDWWAGALLRQRKLDDARKVCRRGLERSRRKYMLCVLLGEVAWEQGVLAEAVYWWAQAVHCQESLRDRTGENKSYLYLHCVAAGVGEPEVAAAFLQQADSIRPGTITRLDSAAARSLTELTSRQRTPDIREVLTRLRARYLP